jgi:hypothetical protein
MMYLSFMLCFLKLWYLFNNKLAYIGNGAVNISQSFLGAFAKSRKAPAGFFMSVRLSVCPSIILYQFGSHWTDFREI